MVAHCGIMLVKIETLFPKVQRWALPRGQFQIVMRAGYALTRDGDQAGRFMHQPLASEKEIGAHKCLG
jgi:hypothetical protein